MRSSMLALGSILALGAGLAVGASGAFAAPGLDRSSDAEVAVPDAAAPAPAPEAAALEGGAVQSAGGGARPEAEPGAAEPASELELQFGPEVAPAAMPAPPSAVPGAVGFDSQGRQGWIHVVVGGDTLWDISDVYLGTPWVWPSIWQENDEIDDPHLIHPGDRIWITPTEMRRVTAAEAAELLAGAPSDIDVPAAFAEDEAGPVLLEGGAPPRESVRYPNIEAVGLLSVEELDASSSVVDSPSQQMWLAAGSSVFLGLGEGEAEVGDRFTVFRNADLVRDPDTGRALGHFVDVLGWVEVTKIHPEVVEAQIRASFSEIRRGDPIVPREPIPSEIELRPPLEVVDGHIAYVPLNRSLGATNDFVYLNRGALHGLDVGNRLQVFRPLGEATDPVRRKKVSLPDHVIANLLVVSARPETAVAVVTGSRTELLSGDRFRSMP